tara:strand:+ start:99 stop:314 length:216 start_codon:yes stop_codon:yes gene_type:complete
MNLTLTELIRLSDALADKIDYMVQNGDGTDVQQNIDYANYKALFKKVNDEYAKQWVKTPYADKKIIPLKGE